MTTLRLPLSVPGVTEAEVDVDARVVGVEEFCPGCSGSGSREDSLCDGNYQPLLLIKEPGPRVRTEQRCWTVTPRLASGPTGAIRLDVPTNDALAGYSIWEQRL